MGEGGRSGDDSNVAVSESGSDDLGGFRIGVKEINLSEKELVNRRSKETTELGEHITGDLPVDTHNQS